MTEPRHAETPQPPEGVPAVLLMQLIQDVWNPVEVKIVLAVASLGGRHDPVAEAHLIADADLLAGVRADGSSRSPEERLREALGSAIARGIVIALSDRPDRRWLVLGTDENRRRAHAGQFRLPAAPEPVPLPIQRPGVFALYEQNIGLITPIIADRLADALSRYPEVWIRDAIGEAVAYNRRSWRYIERILENWAVEGRSDEAHRRDHEAHHDSRTSLRERYAAFFRKR